MQTKQQNPAPVVHAVVANRITGDLRTVPTSELPSLTADWVVVLREPEDVAPTLTEGEALAKYASRVTVELLHLHDGGKECPACPQLPKAGLIVTEPKYWTADDLAAIHHYATDVIRASALRWRMHTTEDRRRKPAIHTVIEIDSAWRGRWRHEIRLTFPGAPNTATTVWLMQQAEHHGLAVVLPADPSVTDLKQGRSMNNTAALLNDVLAPNSDRVLARLRRVFQQNPLLAITVEEWLAQVTTEKPAT